tara:strand:- start:357 stop:569 length:213 start_codon:yes stop_codon:yes gene_type:complete
MVWWSGDDKKIEENTIPYKKCSDCGDYKEVSKKYINKLDDSIITICYDCGKKRYIESLMVVSVIDGFDDF